MRLRDVVLLWGSIGIKFELERILCPGSFTRSLHFLIIVLLVIGWLLNPCTVPVESAESVSCVWDDFSPSFVVRLPFSDLSNTPTYIIISVITHC